MGIFCESNKNEGKIPRVITINNEDTGPIKKEIYAGNVYVQNSKIDKVSKCVCKIILNINDQNFYGTGFFMKVSFSENNKCKFLVSNQHIISEDLLNKEIEIELHNKKTVTLKLDTSLYIEFFGGNFDVTVIQINDKISRMLENVEFLDCDMDYINGYEQYKNKHVFASGYPYGDEIVTCGGSIININNFEFDHNIGTETGSSGSPVVLLSNEKLIGIHKQGNTVKNLNEGTFIGIIIDQLREKLKNRIQTNENITKSVPDKINNNNNVIFPGNIENKQNRGINYIINEDRYIGDFKDGVPDGKGLHYYRTGEKYEGYFKKGVREGKGVYYYKNGDRYEGDFKNNRIEGKGILYHINGDKYEGEFKNDKPEGKGKTTMSNGDWYEGFHKNGIPEGKGIAHYSNGERYEGDFKKGRSEGKGKYYFNNGDRYEGEFKDDMMNGKGRLYHKNGDVYEGEFKNGLLEGKGIMHSVNNNINI